MKTTSGQPAIRRAKLQDGASVKSCIERAYAPVKSQIGDLPDVSAGVEEDIATKVVFIAETGTRIAGCAILGLTKASAHLVNLAVDPDFQGAGLGKALIRTVEAHARACGAGQIHLATHVRMPENVALYTHLGWHEASRSGNKVLMNKKL